MLALVHALGTASLVLAAMCVVLSFVLDWRAGNRGFFWGDVGERWATAALVLVLLGAFLASR
jgi:hypothetical protein